MLLSVFHAAAGKTVAHFVDNGTGAVYGKGVGRKKFSCFFKIHVYSSVLSETSPEQSSSVLPEGYLTKSR